MVKFYWSEYMSQTSVDNAPKKRLDSLQAVRAIGFLSIFTSHAGLSMLGPFGVSVFFVLSGFVFYYNYCDRQIQCTPLKNFSFTFKHIKRLYPLHILMLIAAIPFAIEYLHNHPTMDEYVDQGLRLLSCTFLVQTWVPILGYSFSFNAVAWFLATCMFFYWMFPFIVRVINRHNSTKSAIIRIMIAAFIQFCIAYGLRFLNWKEPYYSGFIKWVTYTCPLFRIGDCIIGCELACLYKNDKLKINKWLMTAAELLVFVSVYFAQKIYIANNSFIGSDFFRFSILYLPSACALVYLFARCGGYVSKLLTNKVVIFIGNISGYAFLIHQLAIRYVQKFYPLGKGASVQLYCWVVFIISFAVTILLALLYKYVYDRITKRKSKQA